MNMLSPHVQVSILETTKNATTTSATSGAGSAHPPEHLKVHPPVFLWGFIALCAIFSGKSWS